MWSSPSTGGNFAGVRLWVIDKFAGDGGGFYGGGATTVSLFDPFAGGGIATTAQPAHIMSSALTAPNVGTFLVSYSGLSDGTDEFFQSVRIDNPVGPDPVAFTLQFLNLGDIEAFAGPLPDAPQSGTTALIETNNRRALNAVWRDNSLWMTTTIDPISGEDAGQATAFWFEVDTTDLAAISLLQQGTIGGEDIAVGAHTFFPSIAVNDSGDAVIGFSAAGATIFPTSAYTTRSSALAAGATSGSQILRPGVEAYQRTFSNAATYPASRWGDYSGASVDPFDQCFWVYNKHAINAGTGTSQSCGGVIDQDEEGVWGTAFGFVCESCRTNLDLVGDTSTVESLEARDRIDIGMGTITATGDLTLTSNEVDFGTDFSVLEGGTLTVIIGDCAP